MKRLIQMYFRSVCERSDAGGGPVRAATLGAMARTARHRAKWDAWAPGYGNERQMVSVADIDLTGVPPEFAGHEMAAPSWAEWVERDPMTLHREYNWRSNDGLWHRRYVGVGNGRHRFVQARDREIEELPVDVIELAFWPFGQRPADRRHGGPGDRCFIHRDFDADAGQWLMLPRTEGEVEVAC